VAVALPRRRELGVQVPEQLGLRGGAAREIDERIVGRGRSQQVGAQLAATQRDEPGLPCQLCAVVDVSGKQRLRGEVTFVALGEERRCCVGVLVGKWANLDVRHPAPDDSVAPECRRH
jgi:hypothetical protein